MENPKIRFKGFTKDWEQRKFGSLLEETRNKTIFEDEDTLLSCAIDGMYLNSELFSHFRGSSNIGYLKVKKNDLILSAQNLHLGNCNVNLRFEHGIISPAYKVYELVGCNPLFMQAWVKKDSTKDFFLKSSTEGASVCRKNIVWEELYKQELPVPSIEEQTKVGEYFSNLDHLITLHQRKCEQTKKLKKYMLQKMFPQNGAKVPEIRFDGFTYDWEQRKLGDVAQEFKSGNSLKADEIDITGDYPVYGGNGLRGYTSTYNHDGEYALIGRQGALCGNMNYSAGKAYFTEHAVVVKADENNDTSFLYYMLDTMNLGQYSDQSAQPGLAVNKLVKLGNSFPKKEEQQQIGTYFRSLDHLITLHQRKCDELKKMKKYMLQNMFI